MNLEKDCNNKMISFAYLVLLEGKNRNMEWKVGLENNCSVSPGKAGEFLSERVIGFT